MRVWEKAGLIGLLAASLNFANADGYTAALVGAEKVFPTGLQEAIENAGWTVKPLELAELCDPKVVNTHQFGLLVLADASALPAKCAETLVAYLRSGGDLIALNTPLWQRPLINQNGKWIDMAEWERQRAGIVAEHILFDFRPESLAGWERSSDFPENVTRHEITNEGPEGKQALHVTVSNLQGWDTFLSPILDKPFPTGHTLTVFSAKADSRTSQLGIEWTEKDGSRWIAVIPVSEEWRQYVLKPKDFRYWESNPARGHAGDCFKPENAVRFTVGVMFSHTGQISGHHEYWLGTVGTTAVTPELEEYLQAKELPTLDTLSPGYKYYDIKDLKTLEVRRDMFFVSDGQLPVPRKVKSSHPRPRGAGLKKGSPWRWVPLIEARGSNGEWRGAPGVALLHFDGDYKGGIWASFGVGEMDWYESPEVLRVIRDISARMRGGIFIADGGANHYTYFEGQAIELGVQVCNLSAEEQPEIITRVMLTYAETGRNVLTREWTVPLGPGELKTCVDIWQPETWPNEGFLAIAEVIVNGAVVDRVSHEVHVWKPKQVKEFVTVRNGDFILDGKRWRPHGVNYMPSSGIGTEDREYFEHWLGSRSYDPEVINRDLERVKGMGFNSVSIFIDHKVMRDQNLLDLLRTLDELGLKANLSLRPGTPMDFQWEKIREIIEYYHLSDNDTVFAYDLAWEPMFGMYENRRIWDSKWEKWIIERYGSIERAEKDWGFSVPRDTAGNVTGPSSDQMENDGEWRRMVSAYRRFLDTLLYEKYSAARRLVRSIDPNHLVSFRMSEAGNPTFRWGGRVAYDFPYLAAAVDFLAPEAYGRIGDWERVKPGWFEFEYARFCAPEKPMIWAEMGYNTWDPGRMAPTQENLEFQANYYTDFYRMLILSGADGIFFWWYPGGFRCHENSDYGIINPDGSDRPVTKVIREHSAKYLNGPDARQINHWIEIDRDARADGINGIYSIVKDEFWRVIESGGAPGLKTAGTGTTSADCPLVAVGNTPWDGTNPAKYLDAWFDVVEVQNADGNWCKVFEGDTVVVQSDEPFRARVEFTNLGEAKLLPGVPVGKGGVSIVIMKNGKSISFPLSSAVNHLESGILDNIEISPAWLKKTTEITITFALESGWTFGERLNVQLKLKGEQ